MGLGGRAAPMTSSQLHDVRRYFGAKAATYQATSGRGLWRLWRRWETGAVMALARPRTGEAILDAGCGAGHYTGALLGAGARVTALDAEPAMLDVLRKRLEVETIAADLMTVRLEPVFDKVVCAGTLEFVAEPGRVLANLAAGLRAGGPREITILVPSRWTGGGLYRAFHRSHGVRVHTFSRADLRRLAAGVGLRVNATRLATHNFIARLGPA